MTLQEFQAKWADKVIAFPAVSSDQLLELLTDTWSAVRDGLDEIEALKKEIERSHAFSAAKDKEIFELNRKIENLEEELLAFY